MPEAPELRTGRNAVVLALCLLASVVCTYLGSFRGVFVFDDRLLLLETAGIDDFHPLFQKLLLFGGNGSVAAGRPLVAASFMLNLALDPQLPRSPFGYHLVNLALHAGSALVLFFWLARTFARVEALSARAHALAFAAALIWALHPLHTSAVTYIAQRAELAMSFFFLLALYASARGFESARSRAWSALCVFAALCCVLCKEVAAVLPLVLLLYDRAFLARGFAPALRKRPALYLGLVTSSLVLAALVATTPRSASVGLSMRGLNPLNYMLSQANAIVHYVRLVFVPNALVLDYGWPVVPVDRFADLPRAFPSYGPSLLCVAAVFAASVFALARYPRLGFLPAWFFLVLAPSSSFVPIATEIMAEHRLYLPSLALIVPAVLLAERTLAGPSLQKLATFALFVIALSAALETDAQNQLYRSDELLWSHNLLVTPHNPRVLTNLGSVLEAHGRRTAALQLFERAADESRAIERPKQIFLVQALECAARVYRALGDRAHARARLREAVAIQPSRVDLALTLSDQLRAEGQLDDAIAVLRASIRAAAADPRPRGALVALLLIEGRIADARSEARRFAPQASDVALDRELAEAARRLGRDDIARGVAREAR